MLLFKTYPSHALTWKSKVKNRYYFHNIRTHIYISVCINIYVSDSGKITNILEGLVDDSGAFHASDWKLYKNTITKLMCGKFGASKVHTNKGSVLIFDSDKLERIARSYNVEIKIKTTLKTVMKSQNNNESGASEMSMNYGNNVAPAKDSDGSDGCDGSRDSASDTDDNDAIVVTASNQQDIRTNIIDKVQGITPGLAVVVY